MCEIENEPQLAIQDRLSVAARREKALLPARPAMKKDNLRNRLALDPWRRTFLGGPLVGLSYRTLHKEKEGHLRGVAQGRVSEGVVTSEDLSAQTPERK